MIRSISANPASTIPSMHEKRESAAVASIDDNSFIVLGGNNPLPLSSCEVYDGNINKWTRLSEDIPYHPNICAAVTIDRNIYVVGGKNHSRLLSYSLDTKKWERKKEMKRGRHRCAAAACNGQLFVFGGQVGRDCTDDAAAYDPVTDTWKDMPRMPEQRFDFTATTVDDKIYIIGGRCDKGYLASVNIFNVTTEEWKKGDDMPTLRGEHAAVTIGNLIAVIGGCNEDEICSTLIYEVSDDHWWKGPSMATPRFLHTAATINENTVVIAGGYGYYSKNAIDTAEMISFKINRASSVYNECTSVKSEIDLMTTSISVNPSSTILPMREKRYSAVVASIDNNSFIVMGGFDRDKRRDVYYQGVALSSCEVYDGNTNQWNSLPEDILLDDCDVCAAVTIDRNIYVIGGGFYCKMVSYSLDTKKWEYRKAFGTYLDQAAAAACNGRLFVFCDSRTWSKKKTVVYNPVTDTWKDLPKMPQGRSKSAAITVDDKIYIIGGYRVSSVDIFNVTTEEWEKGPEMPTPRHGHAAVRIGKLIVVIGGEDDHENVLSSTLIYDVNEKKWSNGPSINTARVYHTAATINENTVVIAGGRCKEYIMNTAEMISFNLNNTPSENKETSKSSLSRTKILEKEFGITIEGSLRTRIRTMETKMYGSIKEGKLVDRLDKLENDFIG